VNFRKSDVSDRRDSEVRSKTELERFDGASTDLGDSYHEVRNGERLNKQGGAMLYDTNGLPVLGRLARTMLVRRTSQCHGKPRPANN
jgi:hypothetical protein